jgi:hypothetical protein
MISTNREYYKIINKREIYTNFDAFFDFYPWLVSYKSFWKEGKNTYDETKPLELICKKPNPLRKDIIYVLKQDDVVVLVGEDGVIRVIQREKEENNESATSTSTSTIVTTNVCEDIQKTVDRIVAENFNDDDSCPPKFYVSVNLKKKKQKLILTCAHSGYCVSGELKLNESIYMAMSKLFNLTL